MKRPRPSAGASCAMCLRVVRRPRHAPRGTCCGRPACRPRRRRCQPGADVVTDVRCLVRKALVAVRLARLLLGFVLRVPIGSLRVVHGVETSFAPAQRRVESTLRPLALRPLAGGRSGRYQRRCTPSPGTPGMPGAGPSIQRVTVVSRCTYSEPTSAAGTRAAITSNRLAPPMSSPPANPRDAAATTLSV